MVEIKAINPFTKTNDDVLNKMFTFAVRYLSDMECDLSEKEALMWSDLFREYMNKKRESVDVSKVTDTETIDLLTGLSYHYEDTIYESAINKAIEKLRE